MVEMHPARLVPPIVKHGLITLNDWNRLQAAIDSNDLQQFVQVAIPLCENCEPLFALLFLKFDDTPHIYAQWDKVRKHNRILIRLARSFAKTSIFTFATMIHRICYSVVPGSIHEDPRLLALFETRDRANDRMLAIRQLFETGGPGGLINAVFRGPPGTAWAGMTIPEIASRYGEWNNRTISLPHPRGHHKPDPNIRTLSPGEATVGFHPKIIIADDLVGQKTAGSQKRRETLSKWFSEAVLPMLGKPYTKFWAPHTLFHDDDLNRELEKKEIYYTMIIPALNRFPDRDDFIELRDEQGILTGVQLTRKGEELKSAWPCPTLPEADCPMTEAHYREVGEHRPVKSLILLWKENPLKFALQMMHIIRTVDVGSVRPWMLRFYAKNPNDKRLGQVASWHADWDSWQEEYPDAGLNKRAPTVVLFTADGVQDERGGKVSPVERAVHGWDLAYGRLRTNDRTCCARLYRTADKRYFATFDKGRWKHDQVWRKIVLNAVTDPIKKPDEVALEVDTQQIYPVEVRKLMQEMNVSDRFKLTEIRRTKDKDTVFQNSGLPIAMSNGLVFVDLDDEDAILELLSVTPDETGGHDDCFDSLTNAYGRCRAVTRMVPGFFGAPLAPNY